MRHFLSTDNKMSLHRETTPNPSILDEGRSHSDTCIYRPTGYVPRSVNTDGIPSTYIVQTSPSKKTYSMGWLSKLIKPKSEETKFLPIPHEAKPSIIKERVPTENGGPPPHVLQHIPSPTTHVDNVYYTMKLKIHKLSDYATSWQELSKSPSNISVVNEGKKRKTGDTKSDMDIHTKRKRESLDDNNNLRQHVDNNNLRHIVDDNNNLRQHIDNNNNLRQHIDNKNLQHIDDNNNNLEDDELDAEVAMYMENSGPPTTRADIPDRGSYMEPAYTEYQTESTLPWLRCIEGCYHSYRSPIELTKSPPKILIVKQTKKRKADDLDSDIHTKRRRESLDDNNNPRPHTDDINNLRRHTDNNNNLRHFVDDNNNLEDDELDAEVAMYTEKSGPPTIRADNPGKGSCMGPEYIGYQTESPLPWLRCIEGCYHSYRSPLGITREPREGAIRILDPWPCLYRNTKYDELKKVGGLNEERAPEHWRKGSENN